MYSIKIMLFFQVRAALDCFYDKKRAFHSMNQFSSLKTLETVSRESLVKNRIQQVLPVFFL